jgi:hypothetical protein
VTAENDLTCEVVSDCHSRTKTFSGFSVLQSLVGWQGQIVETIEPLCSSQLPKGRPVSLECCHSLRSFLDWFCSIMSSGKPTLPCLSSDPFFQTRGLHLTVVLITQLCIRVSAWVTRSWGQELLPSFAASVPSIGWHKDQSSVVAE